MITAGIDVGAKTTKVIILKDGEIIGRSMALTGFDQLDTAQKVLADAIEQAGVSQDKVSSIFATGTGRKAIPFATDTVTEVIAVAKGAYRLFPKVRTIVDVGAEEARAAKCNAEGKVVDMAANEKCAAGAGAFVETMARALEVDLEEMGPLSLQSQKDVPMNAQCTVFAESEVVSLIHARTPKPDIIKAVHDAMASRVSSMVRRIGVEKEAFLAGGVAKNAGFVKCLENALEVELHIPEEPDYVSALGAALVAAE